MTHADARSGREPEVEDVLNEFVADIEDNGASYALLEKWAARYPEYAQKLADIAAGEALLRYSSRSVEEPGEASLLQAGLDAARGVLDRARADRPAVAAAPDALPGLMARAREVGLNIRQVADRTQLSVTLVAVLDRRLVRYATIPGEVVDALASALQAKVESVAQYLQQNPSLAPSASFRAEEAPTLPPIQDFGDALRNDPTMDENRRAALLRLIPPASS